MRSVQASPTGIASPEVRWWFSRFAVPLLPIGLQLAAWTSDPGVFFLVPLIGFAMFGFAFFSVIVSIFAYMMDSYKSYSVGPDAGRLGSTLWLTGAPLVIRPAPCPGLCSQEIWFAHSCLWVSPDRLV